MKHQIINIDKTIKELTNRLDEVHPYSASSSINNDQNRNDDGITYWKGKKIISTKAWNDLYQKSLTYTDIYTTILTSRKPLQYFPDDYNGSISVIGLKDEKLKEDLQNWNTDYYELLEYRKNPTLGRMKCSNCLLSGSNDDPIFVGMEKVFARIVSNQCNKNKNIPINTNSNGFISYHCNVMNLFSCPFESKEEEYHNNSIDGKDEKAKYPFKKEDLFTLHQISFAIEQAITTFFEITKDNEIIYEVDFENDRVQEIHTKYSGEPESWGWQENVKEQLSKVKPISTIKIRDEQDVYSIVTNKEKLECLLQENEKNYQLDKEEQVCCDENTPCVNNFSNEKLLTSDNLLVGSSQYQVKYQDNVDYLHNGKNRHSKNKDVLENKNIKLDLNKKIKEGLEQSHREQQILLEENKQNISDFLLDNIDSIRLDDLKIYEPVYKSYRQKGHCHICNSLSNIICKNCYNNSHYNIKEVWLCTSHWQQHSIKEHN